MGRSFRIPGLIDLMQVDARSEIRSLANDARLDRKFDLRGPLINRVLVLRVRNALRIAGMPLPSVVPRDDPERKSTQDKLRQRLDPAAGKSLWDEETIAGLVAAVRDVPAAPAIGPATQQAVGRLFAPDYKASSESWTAARVLDEALHTRNPLRSIPHRSPAALASPPRRPRPRRSRRGSWHRNCRSQSRARLRTHARALEGAALAVSVLGRCGDRTVSVCAAQRAAASRYARRHRLRRGARGYPCRSWSRGCARAHASARHRIHGG
jgi:hypothetical protein